MFHSFSSIAKFHKQSILHTFIIILFIATTAHSFYLELIPEQPKCYLITIFPNQNVLLHVRLPIIEEKIEIQVDAYVKGNKVFKKLIRKAQDKITVNLDNTVKPGNVEEVQTCIRAAILAEDQKQKQRIRGKKYLMWFSQMSNFIKHIKASTNPISQELNKQEQSDDQKFNQYYLSNIEEKLARINATYEQQLKIYENNQERDTKNDQQLYNMLSYAYIVTIVETGVIFASIFGYVWILYQYL